MKNIAIGLGIIIILGLIGYILLGSDTTETSAPAPAPSADVEIEDRSDTSVVESSDQEDDEMEDMPRTSVRTIGVSVAGNEIVVNTFGTGPNDVLVVGGIHGAYAPNTSALAERIIRHAEDNEQYVPEGVTLHVIPSLNPDGLANGASPAGRFNDNDVDLNRNFDCEWQAEGVWQNRAVSGGTAPFSEPESAALRDYIEQIDPVAAVVYYSAGGGVYASNCRGGVSSVTAEMTSVYAEAADYEAFEEFDFYQITGDAVNWMAKEGIPAISVLLSDYSSTEWEKNKAGLSVVLETFSE